MSQDANAFDRRKVALLIHTSTAWCREILAGIAEQSSSYGGWDCWLEQRGAREPMTIPESWHGDGVICRLNNDALKQQIEKSSRPAINVSTLFNDCKSAVDVISDENACGKLAAEFFVSRGWKNFGYVGPTKEAGYTNRFESGFNAELAKSQNESVRFLLKSPTEFPIGKLESEDLSDWLSNLPKPVAIVVWNTTIGHELSKVCLRLGMRVPDDVAILALELEPVVSALSPIPIAFIDQAPRRVGIEATRHLERMMQGETPPSEPVLIAPRGIAERLSVDSFLVEDELIKSALTIIRQRINLPLSVGDLASAVGVGRKTLEKRFSSTIGKSPAIVIRQTKLNHSQHLLRETKLSILEIAERTGFYHLETFFRFFKRESGSTPNEYRYD